MIKYFILVVLLLPAFAQAQEARCTELGSNCICSEPLAGSIVKIQDNYFDSDDNSTKECIRDGAASIEIGIADGDFVTTNQTTILSALPSGHSVPSVLERTAGHTSFMYIGQQASGVSSSFARVAARWYIYYSSDHKFGEPSPATCNNSKVMQFDNSLLLDYISEFFHAYNYTTWSPSTDCCSGPVNEGGSFGETTLRGKWWRMEAAMTGRQASDFRLQVWLKNVTDNGTEVLIHDTNSHKPGDLPSSLTPPSLMTSIAINTNRFGTCAGYQAYSHYMYAAWTTDSGQRIGAAEEVEPSSQETPSIGVSFSYFREWMVVIGLGMLLFVGGLFAAAGHRGMRT